MGILSGSARTAMDRFFAPQPQQAMVIARVALGLLIFVSYASKFPYVQQLYGPNGIGGAATLARLPALDPGRPLEAPLQFLHLIPSEGLVWLLYALLLLASLCFAAGAWTRTAGLCALLLNSLFHARNQYAYLGWAIMLKPFLFFVVVSAAGRYASIDAWRRRGREAPVPVESWSGPGWPVRMLQLQLCTMYAVAGWSRLDDPAWLSGDMLFVALDGRTYGRLDVDWFPVATQLELLTYAAFVLEPLAPFLLWIRGIGKWWALALIAMHVTLELLTNVDWWQWMMIPLLLVFLPSDWLSSMAKPFRRISGAGLAPESQH